MSSKRLVGAVLAGLGLLAIAGCSGDSGQSIECRQYLACVLKVGGSTASLESSYGSNGSCWTDPSSADTCNKYCKSALAAFPSEAGC